MESADICSSQDLSGGDSSQSSIIITENNQQTEISLEIQRYRHRQWLFIAVCIICALLYAIFFSVMWMLATHIIMLQMFVAHRHVMGLLLALLLVPSAMLWGLVRAVFRIDPAKEDYTNVLKEGFKIHPSL